MSAMPEFQCFLSFLLILLASVSVSSRSTRSWNYSTGTALRLSMPLIGEDGRIYACSHKTLFAFGSNGSIDWSLDLDFACNLHMPPRRGSRGTMYVVAEQRVLKVNYLKRGTSESATQVFFGPGPHQQDPGEIIGVAVSILNSLVFINVKNRGLFAFTMHGQLFWSVGPVLDQFGYRQGCRRTVTDCYFTSVPVVDPCEASIYISNTQGELYSLSVRSHHFNWIQDFSSFDTVYTVTPGNNGQLYVTIPLKALVLALDASTGNILWQGSVGPLSTAEYAPVVDANGWISIGSLDGFLYSFSPDGTLKKFSNSATLDSVIQISPLAACSGFAIYISQTKMNGKITHTNGGYTYVSTMKPISVVFSLLVPAAGSVYWSESYPGQFASLLSGSDLQHFLLDENLLLAFVTASSIGNPIPCSTTRQMLASSCSQARPMSPVIYTGNDRAILLFLLFETVVLLVLVALVRFCCIFWRKKKLRGQQLGNFLENRRSLQLKRKALDRRITELEQKAAEEAVANEVMEKLSNLVQEREGTERKLSTTYSLGRDGAGLQSKSLLPMYDNLKRSYSFRNAKKERVAIFHTLSDTSSIESSTEKETSWDSEEDKESKGKGKAKAFLEDESSSGNEKKYWKSSSEPASSSKVYIKPLFVEEKKQDVKGKLVESLSSGFRRVLLKRRRTLSSTH